MKLHQFCIISLSFCHLFLVTVAFAAPPVHKDRSKLPITIKSNEMSADNKGKTAIFTGKVVAKQGDIIIFSDKLVVNYADKSESVEKIEATGNVRIVQEDRTGFADQAVYESNSGRIILTGTPRVVQGSDSISGKVITYYVDDERSDVSSGGDPKSRVEAVINPPARKSDAGNR
ncbi:MAG: lipopolysaccharide transport periplasmic protein LptA [Desulfuromonadaceae bacterium]|nr:lipopolysaccharide transport periplasmic protein LptA [Desulfuromonadaceae bacterium]MDD2847837.1 lipopolysaccharide transport periplasmic protein LptA [Desulfuromonadaceae bacterium]MDD4129618.1 lipopolysaccharide transport periplasmic protein LptA [Desulfuromonadaceae bacterium]